MDVHYAFDTSAYRWLPRPNQTSLTFAHGFNATARPSDNPEIRECIRVRRAMGLPLPFAHIDSLDTPSDFFVPNAFLQARATRCMKPAMGSYYMRASLVHPEGRHLCIYRTLQEVLGCAAYLGWPVTKERAFALIAGIAKPSSELEQLTQRFGQLLLSPPNSKLTPSSLTEAYGQLLGGLSIEAASQLDERIDPAQRERFLEDICAFLYDQGETAMHPVVKALLFMESIRSVKPFPTANLLMARVAYSWASIELGIPTAAFVPIVDFLGTWLRAQTTEGCYEPRIPLEQAVLRCANYGTEWTPWLEEMLGFLANDLESFETQLILLYMKRERIEHLMKFEPSLNERQRVILIEALLHEDAEFTYASTMETFGIAYATAYSDLGKLESKGYLRAVLSSKATVFIAAPSCREVFLEIIKEAAPREYEAFYKPNGELSDAYLAEREANLEKCKKSTSIKGDYLNVSTPSMIPERCFVILTEAGKGRQSVDL